MAIRNGVSGQRRIGVAQHLGVGVEWIIENLSCWTLFHQPPQVHDGDLVRHVLDHAKVVSNEEIRQLEFALERDEQIQNLRLHGNVESTRRLIQDDEFRIQRKSTGDRNALPLTPGELVRVTKQVLWAKTDSLEQLENLLIEILSRGFVVHPERATDDVTNQLPRVE